MDYNYLVDDLDNGLFLLRMVSRSLPIQDGSMKEKRKKKKKLLDWWRQCGNVPGRVKIKGAGVSNAVIDTKQCAMVVESGVVGENENKTINKKHQSESAKEWK